MTQTGFSFNANVTSSLHNNNPFTPHRHPLIVAVLLIAIVIGISGPTPSAVAERDRGGPTPANRTLEAPPFQAGDDSSDDVFDSRDEYNACKDALSWVKEKLFCGHAMFYGKAIKTFVENKTFTNVVDPCAPKTTPCDGNYKNAVRHFMWQSTMAVRYEYNTAVAMGDAHEAKADLSDPETRADSQADQQNNQVGRRWGTTNGTWLNRLAGNRLVGQSYTPTLYDLWGVAHSYYYSGWLFRKRKMRDGSYKVIASPNVIGSDRTASRVALGTSGNSDCATTEKSFVATESRTVRGIGGADLFNVYLKVWWCADSVAGSVRRVAVEQRVDVSPGIDETVTILDPSVGRHRTAMFLSKRDHSHWGKSSTRGVRVRVCLNQYACYAGVWVQKLDVLANGRFRSSTTSHPAKVRSSHSSMRTPIAESRGE